MIGTFPPPTVPPWQKAKFWLLPALLLIVLLLITPGSRPLLPPVADEAQHASQAAHQGADDQLPGTVTVTNQPATTRIDPQWRQPAQSQTLALRSLPADLEGVPELMAFRSANSAVFELSEGQYKAIISTDSLHYQTATGAWEIIDPAFRPDPETDSFIVKHNSVRSRAGLSEAWLSAAAGETTLHWQAAELGYVVEGDTFHSLAEAQPAGGEMAEQLDEGRILHYKNGWSDATLSEQLISEPDSVEHLLLLEKPPQASGSPHWLELRAKLHLLPGSSLWVNGQEQTGRFETAGAIEVRHTDGRTVLVLEPVLAFEMDNRQAAVAGEYVVWPAAEDGQWTIGLRTPWSWWVNPERVYPAAIDPTMRVLRTSGGGGTGMAWLGNGGDAPDLNYQMGGMVLGNMQSPAYFGFMQFNVMPALLTNHIVQVQFAELLLTPGYYHMPSYKHKTSEGPGWAKETIAHNATLWQINLHGSGGLCPDPLADPNCWSMVDNRLATNPTLFNWNTMPDIGNQAQTTELETKQLAVGPSNQGGQGHTTPYDVTVPVRDWYALSPQPNHGPAFMIRHNSGQCQVYTPAGPHTPPPYQVEDNPSQVPLCTRFGFGPDSAQLHITYNAWLIGFGDSLLNRPGVPSFYEPILADSNHQYKLITNPGPTAWRAVAVRGNHDLPQTLPARADLKLIDYTNIDDPQTLIENTSSTQNDQTSYILINDHACTGSGICNSNIDLRTEVLATNANNYAQDQGRNYRVEYQLAANHSLNYGTNAPIFVDGYGSDELMRLLQFELAQYDSLGVIVTGETAVEPGLVPPTNDGDPIDTVITNKWVDTGFEYIGGVDSSTQRSMEITDVEKGGVWAMVLANQGPPELDQENSIKIYNLRLDIMRCPWGTIPTIKWECQPVIIPTGSTPSQAISGPGFALTVYSEGGFVAQGGGWCTINEGNGTPMIGPAVSNRWLVVGQGSVCWDGTALTTSADSGVGLAVPHPNGAERGRVSPGFMYGSTMTSLPLSPGVKTGVVGVSQVTGGQVWPTPDTRVNIKPFHGTPLQPLWDNVVTSNDHYIDPTIMKIVGQTVLDVEVGIEAAAAPTAVTWDVPWTLYPGSASSYVFEPEPVQSPPLHTAGGFLDVASLELRLQGPDGPGLLQNLDYVKLPTRPRAWQLRQAQASVAHDPSMGGATKLVQAAVLPPGAPRLPAGAAGAKSCFWSGQSTSCLDVRLPTYQWNNGDGDKNVPMWEMPDVHLEGNAGTLMVGGPEGLFIFSEDHPLNRLSAQQVSQSFSFDTWDATVSIDIDKCFEQDTEDSTVIRGQAVIGLPTVGETGVPPSILVGFKLCNTQFAEAILVLEIPTPGIPVGSTGVGVNLIGGKVTVGPENVQIELTVGFQTMDGTTLSDGFGTILIDTAGLFQLTAGATIVQALNAELLLQVAWEPLDILVQATVDCCGGLIEGELYMHAWIGQGFQNKYPWLPDNNDFHFTGYIQAGLYIPEDYVIPFLPPFDITISLKISFGEFCANATCTDYAWGMSAVLTIFNVDLGLYVGENGAKFIFGTDDNVLIDQFGGGNSTVMARLKRPLPTTYAAGAPPSASSIPIIMPGNWQPELMPMATSTADDWPVQSPADHGCTGNAMGPTLHCTFTVAPGTGRAVFNTAWQNGSLQLTLTAPDNTVITEANAPDYGITITGTFGAENQVTYALRPLPNEETVIAGNWTLTLDNIGVGLPGNLSNNYRIIWFTDPPPPSFDWITPAAPGTTPAGSIIDLEWTALRAGQPLAAAVEMELIYTPVISKPLDLEEFNGTLVVNRIKALDGSYAWDTSHLAAGEYAVAARLDDQFAGNGTVVSWAPGTVVISDTIPPPAPNILSLTPIHDALIVEFERPNVPDLAGYLIEYTIPRPDEPPRMMTRRLNPRGKWYVYFDGQQIWFDGTEQVRLGGLLNGFTTQLCIRAYDNSGNVGPCHNVEVELPRVPPPRLGAPQNVTIRIRDSGFFDVIWSPPATGGPPAGYLVAYAPFGCHMPDVGLIADQGPAPIDVGNVTNTILSGLTPGQFYTLGVAAYDGNGSIGPTAGAVARYGDMTDGDGDGLPDAWANAWGVSGADDDPDMDGLTNEEEYEQGSNPLHADSDGDGFYDGEEFEAGTDPCNALDKPAFQTQPRLTLFGPEVVSLQVAANEATSASRRINVFNLGGSEMQWTAVTDHPWINLNITHTYLDISVDPAGLAPGFYTGTVEISSSPAATLNMFGPALPESYTLPVAVTVLRQQETVLYMPLIQR
jgi:hypothetical protein